MTVKVSKALFPEESTAMYSTTVLPIANNEPGKRFEVRLGDPELSIAVGSVQLTFVVGNPLSAFWVMLDGIFMTVGFSKSKKKIKKKKKNMKFVYMTIEHQVFFFFMFNNSLFNCY